MRLTPAPTSDEAYQILTVTAALTWGLAGAAEIDKTLRAIAEAMATLAAIEVPEATEPLFSAHETFEPLEDAP